MDDLFKQSESRTQKDSEKRQHDIIEWNKVVALSRPIWERIKRKLVDRVEAFNARVPEGNKITIVPSSQEFSMEFKHQRAVRSFMVVFTPVAGTITCYVPFTKSRGNETWLSVKVTDDGGFSIQNNLPDGKQENVDIEEIDEVILKEYLASYLR
jgi:hypothetical protein